MSSPTRYRAAWTVIQQDGTLVTLYGALHSSLEDAVFEAADAGTVDGVQETWVEAETWQRLPLRQQVDL